jgi:4-hydroxybenzoate polyprenyltransferase
VAVTRIAVYPADLPAWLLLLIVTLWIGGFDLIYACQDVDFDREYGLHSIPARYGISFALRLSTDQPLPDGAAAGLLGVWMALSWPFWMAFVIVMGLLIWEHRLVKPDDLSNINLAFFNINSYISLALFAGVLGAGASANQHSGTKNLRGSNKPHKYPGC